MLATHLRVLRRLKHHLLAQGAVDVPRRATRGGARARMGAVKQRPERRRSDAAEGSRRSKGKRGAQGEEGEPEEEEEEEEEKQRRRPTRTSKMMSAAVGPPRLVSERL